MVSDVNRFNSRTPGGVRPPALPYYPMVHAFQFTHPGRGATALLHPLSQSHLRFNSRTPGGVRLSCRLRSKIGSLSFNSRTPGGVRRSRTKQGTNIPAVSIHAPREGCDAPIVAPAVHLSCFNSRTPGGVRRLKALSSPLALLFQFTHPGRGATRSSLTRWLVAACFNSRTPGGVRLN